MNTPGPLVRELPEFPDPTDSRIRCGEMVPFSGIYTVEHYAHAEDHEVLLLEGERFPACAVCGQNVVFRLKIFSDHVSRNRFFRDHH